MKHLLIFALIPLILSIGIVPALPFDDALALKSKGNLLTETGSNKVCGDKLCSKVVNESITETQFVTQKHPNIVFILTDNQAIDGLSVYGNKDVNTPNIDRLGRSFVPHLLGEEISQWGHDVYFEQDETRGIRTSEFAYWDRPEGTGEPVLFDMRKDTLQMTNVYDSPEYQDVIQELDRKLDSFFDKHADPKYDLWNGDSAKVMMIRPQVFLDTYGEDWSPIVEVNPIFEE